MINLFLVAIVTLICSRWCDRGLAIYVKRHLYGSMMWKSYTSEIPDFLLLITSTVTLIAFMCYRYRKKKKIEDAGTSLSRLVAYAVPASYAVKSCLKFTFGRANPREWLVKPEIYGFHWFHGGDFSAFPSGHMAVFATIAAAFWRFFPQYRTVCSLFIALLAAALVATNYHFLSDVIAGTYLGIIVEVGTYNALTWISRRNRHAYPAFRGSGEKIG